MNNRLKEIDLFISSIKSEEDYKKELLEKEIELKNKFKEELNDYKLVTNLEDLYNLKSAGYIRYVNYNDELKFGGILLKVFKSEEKDDFKKKNLLLIQNSNNNKWVISWEKNYIFYKNQTKKGDNLRSLFVSILESKKF